MMPQAVRTRPGDGLADLMGSPSYTNAEMARVTPAKNDQYFGRSFLLFVAIVQFRRAKQK
jgi:hypothetical protein